MNPKKARKLHRREEATRSSMPSQVSSTTTAAAASNAPPNIDEILNRDDFVITNPSRYKFVFSSQGPPRAEVHLVTAAHIVLPDHKLATNLSDDVIPDLVQARVQVMQDETDAAGKKEESASIAQEVLGKATNECE